MVDWWPVGARVGWGGEFSIPDDLPAPRSAHVRRPRLAFGFGCDFWRSQHVSDQSALCPYGTRMTRRPPTTAHAVLPLAALQALSGRRASAKCKAVHRDREPARDGEPRNQQNQGVQTMKCDVSSRI